MPQRFVPGRAAYCLAGEYWLWDGVDFRFLYPDKQYLGLDNNSSCVLRISVGKKHLLLTGDIEKPAEDFLVQHERKFLPTTVLIAQHHGSKTSSSLLFLQCVHPKYVLYLVGYLNRFHFPSIGAVSLVLRKNKPIKPIGWRQEEVRFWRQNS